MSDHFRPVRRNFRSLAMLRSVAAGVGAAITFGAFVGCSDSGPAMQTERTYLVTLDQLDSVGYHVAWESAVAVSDDGRATQVMAWDDYVLAIEDGRNFISVLDTRDGRPLWDESVGTPLESMRGVVRHGNQILASTQSDLYYYDIATGRVQEHQRYDPANSAGTAPVIYGPFAIYGTVDGRIIYHHMPTGLMKSAYRFDAGVHQPVLPVGSSEAAVFTESGRIHFMDIVNNSRYWTATVRDRVRARPVVDDTHVYVPGYDQSVWAFRLDDGKLIWRYRGQRPLTDDPTLIGDTLYQSEDDAGLVAIDTALGRARWIASEVKGGTVIARSHDGYLLVWDRDNAPNAKGSTFYRVNERTGSVEGSFHASNIYTAVADHLENGTVYGLSKAGRVIKLIPQR